VADVLKDDTDTDAPLVAGFDALLALDPIDLFFTGLLLTARASKNVSWQSISAPAGEAMYCRPKEGLVARCNAPLLGCSGDDSSGWRGSDCCMHARSVSMWNRCATCMLITARITSLSSSWAVFAVGLSGFCRPGCWLCCWFCRRFPWWFSFENCWKMSRNSAAVVVQVVSV
jgi:hypothetical protein